MSDRPLNVALPTSSFLPNLGGVEVGLHNIAARLAARGHRPLVIAPAATVRQLRHTGWQLPYRVIAMPPKTIALAQRWPDAALRLLGRFFGRVAVRDGIDFWHATVGHPTGTALVRFARRRGGAPHLVRCAGDDIQTSAAIGYGMRLDARIDRTIRTWLPQADRLVAISSAVAEEYRALGVGEDQILHIPNGVDIARFGARADKPALRRRLALPDDAFIFFTAGRNHPKKGYDVLLRAAAELAQHASRAFLLVIAGPGTRELQGLVDQHALGGRVRLLGPIGADDSAGMPALPADRLVDLYRAADAFVFASRLETFGIALVEAMAAGLPVITTDAPGCRDVAGAGAHALTVAAGDSAALAAAMADLLATPARTAAYADRAAARARDFSWDHVVDRYVEAYRRGISAQAGPSCRTT